MENSSNQFVNQIEGENNEFIALIQKENDDLYDTVIPYSIKAIKKEFIYLFKSAVPLLLSTIIQYVIPLINIYSVGRIGKAEINGVALGAIFSNATGNSILLGMASALDTLCSQAFTGSNDKKQVGLYLQRGIIIQLIMCIPIALLWWFSEPVLLLLKQDPEVSRLTALYLKFLILGLPPFMIFESLKKYLQAQKIMKAQTIVLVITVPVVALLNYILMWNPATSIGFLGAPVTLVCAYWLMLFLIIAYIYFFEGLECWGGWSTESFHNWNEYIKLGCAGMIMICSELWAWNIVSLIATFLGTDALAAHYISINIDNVFYSFASSISIATSNRVGNLLGAEQLNRVKLACLVSLSFAVLVSLINSSILAIFRSQIAFIFAEDEALYNALLLIIPFICAYHVFDSVAGCSNGILRGQGRQKVGAIVNLISWYIVAIPTSIFITFYLGFGLRGMWFGLCLALFGTGTSLSILVLKSNWKQLILDAKKRLNEGN